MKYEIDRILSDYIKDYTLKVDSKSPLYQILCSQLPNEINKTLNRKDLSVCGSIGKGNRTKYPWVSILNRNITTSTQEGLYLAYLFKKDMSGFYLSLLQGITHFENRFKKKKYEYARKVADYYKSELMDYKDMGNYFFDPIKLGATAQERGYGYEQATIVYKYYEAFNYSEESLLTDLRSMVELYDYIYKHMEYSYDQTINNVLQEYDVKLISANEAIRVLKDVEEISSSIPYDLSVDLIEVSPLSEKTGKFRKFNTEVVNKKDYIKKASEDAKTGLRGEELALQYEKDRLVKLGLSDKEPKWVAQESDSYGFDIQSFDLDCNGNIKKVYIEVKSTTSRVDIDFYVSRNELMTSHKYNEDYYVYRLYDLKSKTPKIYRAVGKLEKNFLLDPTTY